MWPKGGRQIKASETWKGLSSGKTGNSEPYSPNKDVLGGTVVKNPLDNAGDVGSIPGSGRSPGEGNGNLLQYSCLENFMDGGAWQAIVLEVVKS